MMISRSERLRRPLRPVWGPPPATPADPPRPCEDWPLCRGRMRLGFWRGAFQLGYRCSRCGAERPYSTPTPRIAFGRRGRQLTLL